MFIYLERLNNPNGREIHLRTSVFTWVQLAEYLCFPIALLNHCPIHWSTREMESSVMLHFSTSCGNSQVEGTEILLALPGRENMLRLSPIRHQRTHAGWCVLERWQYVSCPRRVIVFVVKLAAETWSICPIQCTLGFPHLCSKALFMKTKNQALGGCHKNVTFYEQDNCCKKVRLWGFFLILFFFSGQLSIYGRGLHAPGSPATKYRNGHCRLLSEASLGNGANKKRNSLCSNK